MNPFLPFLAILPLVSCASVSASQAKTSAWNVAVDFELSLEGHNFREARTQLVLSEGRWTRVAAWSDERSQVLARLDSHSASPGLRIELQICDPSAQKGVLSHPVLVVLPGEEAKIVERSGHQNLKVSVKPVRQIEVPVQENAAEPTQCPASTGSA